MENFSECFIPGSVNRFSGCCKLFFIFFQRLLPGKLFFLSSGNVFLNEFFIPAIGKGFFSLIETVALLESLFLPAEIAMNGNRFLKTEPILAGGN